MPSDLPIETMATGSAIHRPTNTVAATEKTHTSNLLDNLELPL